MFIRKQGKTHGNVHFNYAYKRVNFDFLFSIFLLAINKFYYTHTHIYDARKNEWLLKVSKVRQNQWIVKLQFDALRPGN